MDRVRDSAALRIIAGFALASASLAIFGWLVTGPYRTFAAEPDALARYFVRQVQSPMLTSLFLAVTKLGSTVYLSILGSIGGLVFLSLRMFRPLVLFIVTMAGQAVLHYGAKYLTERARPSALIHYPRIDESFSFPSGHALSALCLFVSLCWLTTNRMENSAAKAGIWIVTLLLVLLIGLSRVYIGVHYASDVVAGFLAAAIWTAAVISLDRKAI